MANFTPVLGDYTELKPFRFWCQKVLPLVYDDSLSYYELLCKVVDYLNKTMEDVDTLHTDVENLHQAYVQLQGYVNDYFDNLDVQEEINNKLDDMAQDGSLTALISPFIPNIVTAWLNEHITPTTPAIDDTLSIHGAGADARRVGQVFMGYKGFYYPSHNLFNPEGFMYHNMALSADGSIYESDVYSIAQIYIPKTGSYAMFAKNNGADIGYYTFRPNRFTMYDGKGNYLGTANNNADAVSVIDNDACAYCLVNVENRFLDVPNSILIIQTDNINRKNGSEYTPYGISENTYQEMVLSNVHNTAFKTNIYNGVFTDGYYVDRVTGEALANANFAVSDYIQIKPLTYYSGTFTNHMCFYDANKTFIYGSGSNTEFTRLSPINAVYARIDWQKTSVGSNDIILVEGIYSRAEIYELTYYNKYTEKETSNLFNLSTATLGKYLGMDGKLNNINTHCVSSYIPVKPNTNYVGYFTNHLAWYAEDFTTISVTNLEHQAISPATAKFARIDCNLETIHLERISFAEGTTLPDYEPHIVNKFSDSVYKRATWYEKTWSAYGDSITAISNGDSLNAGWSKYINEYMHFKNFYGRGIGSQSFAWKTNGGSATFVTADGNYYGRDDNYNKDNYTGEVPEGTTLVRGCFCSWDRITHMYPASIKDSIDLIFIMGGTNDVDGETLTWMSGSSTDPEWHNSSYYSNYGGDYDISTLAGGVASTIMKMQAWMPNALIIVGTPLNGNTNRSGEIRPDYIPDEYDKSITIKKIANIFGCPVIDVFGECNINVLNSPTYITDGMHPYNIEGYKMLAKTITGGLNRYLPKP